jgi:hypothetical protein
MAGAGTGSVLMLRIADGMRRMKAANAIGLTRPLAATQTSMPFQATPENPATQGGIAPNQPPQPATTDISPKDRMRAEAESFLEGLGPVDSLGSVFRGR